MIVNAALNPQLWEFIRNLRNYTAPVMITQHQITPQEHTKFMEAHAGDYWVCIKNARPVGYVGVVDNDLRIAVVPDYRHKGVGQALMNFALMLYPHLHVRVLSTNTEGKAFFQALGVLFEEVHL